MSIEYFDSANTLVPPTSEGVRRRSRSVGDEDISRHSSSVASAVTPPQVPKPSSSSHATAANDPTQPYNERVVSFLRQPNVVEVLKMKTNTIMNHKSLRDKINMIRQEGLQGLERLSSDVELIVLLR